MYKKKPYSKYKNVKVEFDGLKFDSIKEKNRYQVLKALEKGGVIHSLMMQPKFELQAKFTDKTGKKHRNIEYWADFRYYCNDRKCGVVEDVKASKNFTTDVYKIKKKMLLYRYPLINFVEIF